MPCSPPPSLSLSLSLSLTHTHTFFFSHFVSIPTYILSSFFSHVHQATDATKTTIETSLKSNNWRSPMVEMKSLSQLSRYQCLKCWPVFHPVGLATKMLVGSFPADLCRGHKWKSLGISETETWSSGSFTVSIVTCLNSAQVGEHSIEATVSISKLSQTAQRIFSFLKKKQKQQKIKTLWL